MQENHPLVLISNDDGYPAGGICQLIEMLRPMAQLVVMAPNAGRSGAGMAMTVTQPVTVQKVREEEGLVVYVCTGTPVDCVKLAVDTFLPRRPDLVVSGINHGENAGINVHYSGTMGVAMEGCLKRIPSIGFSSLDTDKEADFSPFAPAITDICRKVLKNGLPVGTCLNVNLPLGNSYKGIRVTCQDSGQWFGEWEMLTRKSGESHFWLSGEYRSDHPDDTTTDRWAILHGYVAVTPTTVNVTDYKSMELIANMLT